MIKMKLKDILTLPECRVLAEGDPQRELSRVFCCDLLSIAMGKAPADGVWVTVMGNRNTLAVPSLTATACIALAEGVSLDQGSLCSQQISPPLTSRLKSIRQGLHDSALL